MKITLDLPDALMKQVKIRAVREGRKLKDAVADLLRKGLGVGEDTEQDAPAPAITKDNPTAKTNDGSPLVKPAVYEAPSQSLASYQA